MRDRLLGDVSDAAFDALVSRLRLYETRNRAEAIRTAIDRTGLPPSAVHEMFNKQESVDTLVASALEHIAENTNRPEEPRDTDVTSDDEWFDVFRREASDRSAGEMREAFVRVLAGEVQQPGSFLLYRRYVFSGRLARQRRPDFAELRPFPFHKNYLRMLGSPQSAVVWAIIL